MALKDAGLKASDVDEVVLVGGSTRVPRIQAMVTEFFGKEPHKGVNADEVVALGAGIQAGVLAGDVTDILLLDVTPLTLGIETLGGVFTKLIDRNSTIPIRKSEIFSTAADGQTSVEVHVLQGEREMAAHNKPLGKFHLADIPTARRGVPQIEVTFDIDANGIVNVSAKDLGTGKEQKITITASSGLDKTEVEEMVKDAEAHAGEDRAAREAVDTRNKADQLVYTTEKTLSENEDKLSDATKTSIKEAIEGIKKALEGDDTAAIETACKTLEESSHQLAAELYKNQDTPGADPAAGPDPAQTAASGDDVIDAEVVEQEKGA
jgi:molecular chaperone DnaK